MLRTRLIRPTVLREEGHDDVGSAPAYFFFTTLGFGSGFSACGSKPI